MIHAEIERGSDISRDFAVVGGILTVSKAFFAVERMPGRVCGCWMGMFFNQ
jgi:hypothetical protein